MAEDTDIRGVQTPSPIPMPDATVLDGSASAAEFLGMLRDTVLAGSAAATAAQTAAEAAANSEPPPPSAYSVSRRHRQLSPAQLLAGVASLFVLGANADQLVERVSIAWPGTAPAPVTGPRWQCNLAMGPIGSLISGATLPAEWTGIESGFVTPDVQGGTFVFESAHGYYVPAGQELKIVAFPPPSFTSAQWVEL